ncbi:hypothetical protein R1sor_007939 [Riccia sorocarpa]|uniref:Reverse transcriptase zinc-binding domain-containing protein n=1 Tax=Riccia sorocarpa TaxID=122646 RepID=A0ABD3HS56_9MARC
MTERDWILPQTCTIKQAEQMLKFYWTGDKPNLRIVLPLIKKLNVSTLQHAQSLTGEWKDIKAELVDKGLTLSHCQVIEVGKFQSWLTVVKLAPIQLQAISSWRWQSSPEAWKGWEKPSKFWYHLLQPEQQPEDLTGRWPPAPSIFTWAERWRLLWQKGSSNRTILWVWRVLRKGFFKGSLAVAMRVSNDLCCRCRLESETIVHLFWGCKEVRGMWTHLRRNAFEADSTFRIKESLLATIDEALATVQKGGVLTTILASAFQAIWSDRNKRYFRNQRGKTPLEVILKQSRSEVEASFRPTDSKSSWEKKLETLQEVNRLIERTDLSRHRGSNITRQAEIKGEETNSDTMAAAKLEQESTREDETIGRLFRRSVGQERRRKVHSEINGTVGEVRGVHQNGARLGKRKRNGSSTEEQG